MLLSPTPGYRHSIFILKLHRKSSLSEDKKDVFYFCSYLNDGCPCRFSRWDAGSTGHPHIRFFRKPFRGYLWRDRDPYRPKRDHNIRADHPRSRCYSAGCGPNLGNNGAGTYFANPGSDGHGHALWNFDYYINVATGSLSDYSFKLLYDFNPGVGTDESQLGVWNFIPSGQTMQDSQNLGFGFLSTTIYEPIIIPPSGTFDPNANGEYSFALIASSLAGVELDRSAINVDVGQVPEPATLALFGLGLFGFAAVRRKSSKGARV